MNSRHDKSLLHNSLFNTFYSFLNILFPLITSAYIARVLLPSVAGKVSYAQNIAAYFVTFSALGMPTHGLREISNARISQDSLNKTFSELIIINSISTLVAILSYCFVIFHWNIQFEDTQLYLICGLQIVFNFINVDWFYQGLEEYKYIVLRNTCVKIISTILMFVFIHSKEDYRTYALITVLGTGGNSLFNILKIRKYVSFQFRGLEFEKHLKHLLILAIAIFFARIYSQIDITMLGMMANDAAVGYYTYAHKPISIGISLGTAITAVILPRLAYYYKNERTEFKKLLIKGYRVLCLVAIPLAMGIFLLSNQIILFLFGPDFAEAAQTLRVYTPMILIKCFGDLLCYQVLLCIDKDHIKLPSLIVGAVINLVLNYLLIRKFLQNGAAVASVISELAVDIIQFYYSMKYVKIKYPLRPLAQGLISSAFFIPIAFLVRRLGLSLLLEMVITVVVCTIVYISMNYLAKNQIILMACNKFKLTKKIRN